MSKTLQVAILLAGGSGHRYGADCPKQFVRIGERTVLEHSLAAFEQSPHIDVVVVVSAQPLFGAVVSSGDNGSWAAPLEQMGSGGVPPLEAELDPELH